MNILSMVVPWRVFLEPTVQNQRGHKVWLPNTFHHWACTCMMIVSNHPRVMNMWSDQTWRMSGSKPAGEKLWEFSKAGFQQTYCNGFPSDREQVRCEHPITLPPIIMELKHGPSKSYQFGLFPLPWFLGVRVSLAFHSNCQYQMYLAMRK